METKVVPLIQSGADGHLRLIDEGARVLARVGPKDIIVAVIGPFRGAKSSLLNALYGKYRAVFKTSSTNNSCTLGIHILNDPVNMAGRLYWLVDAEGMGANSADPGNDNRLTTVAMMLANLLVYNTRGNIDQDSIQKLSLISSIAEELDRVNDSKFCFPELCWVLRDVMLDLKTPSGAPMTDNEYLESELHPNNKRKADGSIEASVESLNKTKKVVRDKFRARSCVTMPTATAPEYIKNVSEHLDKLSPSFLAKFDELRRILCKVKPKTYGGQVMDGKNLVIIMEEFIKALNDNKIPNLENCHEAMTRLLSEKYLAQAILSWDKTVKNLTGFVEKKPLSVQMANRFVNFCQKKALDFYRSKCSTPQHEADLFKRFKEDKSQVLDSNAKGLDSLIKHYFSEVNETPEDIKTALETGMPVHMEAINSRLGQNAMGLSPDAKKMLEEPESVCPTTELAVMRTFLDGLALPLNNSAKMQQALAEQKSLSDKAIAEIAEQNLEIKSKLELADASLAETMAAHIADKTEWEQTNQLNSTIISTKEAEVASMRTELERKALVEATTQSLRSKLASAEQEIKHESEKFLKANSQVQSLRQALDQERQKLSLEKAETDKLQKDLQTSSKALTDLRKQHQLDKARLEASQATLVADKEALAASLQAALQEHKKLKEQHEAAQQSNAKTLASKEATIKQSRSEVLKLNQEAIERDSKLSSMDLELKNIRIEKQYQETELASTRETVDAHQARIYSLERQLQETTYPTQQHDTRTDDMLFAFSE